jgi:putative hemolysin
VFRLDDEPIAGIMTPRTDIVWLDVADTLETNLDIVGQHPYSRFPVCEGSLDRTLGIVTVRDIWAAQQAGHVDLRAIVRQPLVVPDTAVALDVLQQFQASATHVALVVDEHGGLDGLLTLNNLMLFVLGPAPGAATTAARPAIVQRDAASWLVDGSASLADFYAAVGVAEPESDEPRAYHTVAGLVMSELGRVPVDGYTATIGSLRLEVVDMDGFRVDKVLVSRVTAPPPPVA